MGQPTSPASARPTIRLALWLFVPGVVAALASRLALAWDGSYFLVDLLDQGHPVMLHRRPSMMLLQLPAWLGSLVTSNTRVLGFLFTLPYVVMPLVVLWLSWVVVRDTRPALMAWPAIGIGLITLPGQAFFVSESVIAAQFVWPLVLALLAGYRFNRWAFGVLLALLFCLHPMTALVFGTAVVVALIVGWRRPAERQWAWRQGALLFGLAVVRQVVTSAGIDSDVPKETDIVAQWGRAVSGVPLLVVIIATVAGAAVLAGWLLRGHLDAGRRRVAALVSWFGVVLLVAAGVLMVRWGSSTRSWWQALDFRSFVLVFALPAVLWALLDALWVRPERGSEELSAGTPSVGRFRPVSASAVVALMGVVFSAVLIAQSVGWSGLTHKLDRAVDRSPSACVLERTLPEHHSALWHWATPALALLEQGRTPERVVVHEAAACQRLVLKGSLSVPRTAKLRKPVRHWFDFGPVRAAIRSRP